MLEDASQSNQWMIESSGNVRQRQHVTGGRVPTEALNPQNNPLSEDARRQYQVYPGPDRKSQEEENYLEPYLRADP